MRSHLPFSLVVPLILVAAPALGDDLPLVTNVEFQPLSAQVRRVVEALDMLGEPLPRETKERLIKAYALEDTAAAVKEFQKALDPSCLIGVEINPESRVKVFPGTARAKLAQNGWRVFLVKVQNDAGVTAELKAQSPNAALPYKTSSNSPEPKHTIPLAEVPQRWLDLKMFVDRPL